MVTVPTAPGPWKISSWTNTRVNGKANANSTGGDDILEWQLAWGTHPTTANFTGSLNSDGSGYVDGLAPGGTYYFWSRQRNSAGWSELSAMTQVKMKDAPDPPASPKSINKAQDSITVVTAPGYNGGVAINKYELGYGIHTIGPDTVISNVTPTSPTFRLDNLIPGKTYYFWARAWNVYGVSAWSARSGIALVAGAWVKQGLTWKRAVPYVRVGGVWVMARPWNKIAGVWKEVQE